MTDHYFDYSLDCVLHVPCFDLLILKTDVFYSLVPPLIPGYIQDGVKETRNVEIEENG
jgi:hypothetical protein